MKSWNSNMNHRTNILTNTWLWPPCQNKCFIPKGDLHLLLERKNLPHPLFVSPFFLYPWTSASLWACGDGVPAQQTDTTKSHSLGFTSLNHRADKQTAMPYIYCTDAKAMVSRWNRLEWLGLRESRLICDWANIWCVTISWKQLLPSLLTPKLLPN